MSNTRKFLFLFATLLLAGFVVFAQGNWQHGRLRVSEDGHYLQFEDGKSFFWLGDTGWELFHRLKKEEIAFYLENRRQKGFTVIQAVVLAEFSGLTRPNQYGEIPLIDEDPTRPNEKYFQLVDYTVKLAMSKNLFMGMLPTWGNKVTKQWGEGPVVFNESNAYVYGKWIGHRYKNYPNIIWILGGDRPATDDEHDWRSIWRSMAKGITEGTEGQALIAYHPSGGQRSTSQYIHDEAWLNINMMQSGHGSGHDVPVWDWIARDRALSPTKPTLDAEPNYEDHPVNPRPKWDSANGYFNDYDVRKQTYRSVFSGACGVTYGHHSVWQFWSLREQKINYADCYWTDAIDRPGAYQVGYLKKLIGSRPQLKRVPDNALVVSGQGDKGEHICSFRSTDSSYAMIYLPYGKKIEVTPKSIKGIKIAAWWYNPRNGKARFIGLLKRQDHMNFVTPTTGWMNDWVLVLDDPSHQYPEPGQQLRWY